MSASPFSARMPHLLAGASLFCCLAACNMQPNPSATEAPMVAPPAAALPMATAASAPVGLAPVASALPAAATPVAYRPAPPGQRYGYVDRAYLMTQAFADTPPDYAVDYQGTRPWVWRARNGAYRIVERLPRGERDYYYEPGQEYPYFVQDPDYGYAYDNGGLAAVYGRDGAELSDTLAARRAEEASRYFDRSRQLYRAAQYQQRQSPYASEWAQRRDDLRAQDAMWQQQQARNPDWRSWHDSHSDQEQQQWRQERAQRAAYAAAIGIAVAATAHGPPAAQPARPAANPAELAQRQAGYFSNWQASRGQGAKTLASAKAPPQQPQSSMAPAKPLVTSQTKVNVQRAQAAQAKTAQANAAQAGAVEAKAANVRRQQAADAQANLVQAQHAQQLAEQAKQHEAAAAQAKAAQAQHAQQLAAEAKRREAAAAQTKAAQTKADEAKAAQAKLAEAKAAQAKAAEAQHAQQLAAQAKAHEAAAAQAKAAEAKAAQAKANQAKAAEAKAAQEKSAEAQHARELAAEAGKAKQNPQGKPQGEGDKKRGPKKDQQPDKPQ